MDLNQDIYAQFKRRINQEASTAQIRKLEYDITSLGFDTAAMKSACAETLSLNFGGMLVQPCQVRDCGILLKKGRKATLLAKIGGYLGGDTTDIKVKAAKKAVRDGADGVEVGCCLVKVRQGELGYVRREIKKLRSSLKKKKLFVSIKGKFITPDEMVKLSGIISECGVDGINIGGDIVMCIELAGKIKAALKDNCRLKVEGVMTVSDLCTASDVGADILSTSSAPELAELISSIQNGTEN